MTLCKYLGGTLDGQQHEQDTPIGREMRRALTTTSYEVYRARVVDRTDDTITYTYERTEPST